jgi:F-type H+-transporting ATPase subunit a
MIPVEVVGQLTRPVALCIRLYANILAGHIVIFSLLGLIFLVHNLAVAPIAVVFALFISMLELFVACLQAYIFTMLTALFMGMALRPAH